MCVRACVRFVFVRARLCRYGDIVVVVWGDADRSAMVRACLHISTHARRTERIVEGELIMTAQSDSVKKMI